MKDLVTFPTMTFPISVACEETKHAFDQAWLARASEQSS